jgi:hypothetical protein
MANRMRSVMRPDTLSSTADHMGAVIRVYDVLGNVIETHEHKGDFREWVLFRAIEYRALMAPTCRVALV